MKRAGRADAHTLPAPDTLHALRRLGRVHAHEAGLGAFSAADAPGGVQAQSVERHAVEKPVDCAEGTEVFAERAPDLQRGEHGKRQDEGFPGEQSAQP